MSAIHLNIRLHLSTKAFTLAEMLVASSVTVVIGAAILTATVGLRKTLTATEQFATSQAAQARLLDYVGRDLRKISGTSAILSPTITTGSYVPIGSSSTTSGTLTLVIPSYYTSGTGNSTNPFVYVDGTMSYGVATSSSTSAIATGTIRYYKAYQSEYGSQCYIRVESEGSTSGTTTIASKADGMLLELIKSGSSVPAAYTARVRFRPTFKSSMTATPTEPTATGDYITATDYVLLRGTN